MAAASTGPPPVGAPRVPLREAPSAVATGVVVFSQPARATPAASAPVLASRPRREMPEGSFKAASILFPSGPQSSPHETLERAFSALAILQHPLRGVVPRRGDHAAPWV